MGHRQSGHGREAIAGGPSRPEMLALPAPAPAAGPSSHRYKIIFKYIPHFLDGLALLQETIKFLRLVISISLNHRIFRSLDHRNRGVRELPENQLLEGNIFVCPL